MVHVDDSVRLKLGRFIAHVENDTSRLNAGVKITHLIGKERVNGFKFVEGIYKFKTLSNAPEAYYFIYSKRNGIHIIVDYEVDGLLKAFAAYFGDSSNAVSETEKVKYVKALSGDLKARQENYKAGDHGDYEVRKKQTVETGGNLRWKHL